MGCFLGGGWVILCREEKSKKGMQLEREGEERDKSERDGMYTCVRDREEERAWCDSCSSHHWHVTCDKFLSKAICLSGMWVKFSSFKGIQKWRLLKLP